MGMKLLLLTTSQYREETIKHCSIFIHFTGCDQYKSVLIRHEMQFIGWELDDDNKKRNIIRLETLISQGSDSTRSTVYFLYCEYILPLSIYKDSSPVH